MPIDTHGESHIHKRIRVHKKYEPYPHPERPKAIIDKTVTVAGLFVPVFTIPQITNIWIEKEAAGVSVVAWTSYVLMAMLWVTYGVMHKSRPIIMIYSIQIVLDALIVFGTLLHG